MFTVSVSEETRTLLNDFTIPRQHLEGSTVNVPGVDEVAIRADKGA